jgi:transcriptional regulator with XRE-family HTH domain
VSDAAQSSFGQVLRRRRLHRGLSQLALAVEAGVSPRHLSFMENGRARPSREMVVRLADRLGLPLRERNGMLLAAGFAPAYAQRDLQARELSAVRTAALRVLKTHEPFPAIALDGRRDVVASNRAAQRLLSELPAAIVGPPLNIYRALLHPLGMASRIVDFARYARHLCARLRREVEISGDAELARLSAEVEAYANVASDPPRAADDDDPALVLRVRHGDAQLAFVTTIATFGSPFDITVAELVIESLFPADEATDAALRTWADAPA